VALVWVLIVRFMGVPSVSSRRLPGGRFRAASSSSDRAATRWPRLRTISTRTKATAMLVLALVFAVTSVQARPTQTAGSRAATAATASTCKIVVTAAAWRIRAAGGSLAGDKYTIAGKGTSCSSARAWVTRFTHQQDTGQIKGPPGFTCRSFSTATSGDSLLYSGICMHPPHNIAFFEWAPKIPRP
jgi:hypothetical protein